MQRIIKMQQLFAVALHELCHRDSRPAGDDPRDLVLCDGIAQQAGIGAGLRGILRGIQLLLQLRQLAVFQLGGLIEIILPLGVFDLGFELFHLRTEILHTADAALFVLPLRFHLRKAVALIGQLLLQIGQMRRRDGIGFLFQCGFFDFQLHDLSGNLVHFGRHGIHFRADHCTGFVYEVDRLIRQETVGDIAVREGRCRDQRRIVNLDAVIDLVALLQTSEDRDCILDGRLTDLHRLEAAFQCGILFDIFAVFIERCRTDAVQLAACEHRLQQIAGIHRAVGLARADDRMQLINEQQDPSL